MDFEDLLVSNLILPVGAIIFVLFCTQRFGWGFENYLKEANTGEGLKISPALKFYFKYILPLIIGFLVTYGLVTYF